MSDVSLAHREPPKRTISDALKHVTDEIARLLEDGVMPWRAPWDRNLAIAATPGLPLRFNGAPYRGANVVLLWAAQLARGYAKRTWLTYRQSLQLGGHVRRGEKACAVVYYGQAAPKGDANAGADDERARSYRFLKLFHVFNVEQIENLPEDFGVELSPAPIEPLFVEQWSARAGVRLSVGGAEAFYAPSVDAIHMPARSAFLSDEHWAATLMHEDIHFTGHKSRLDRLGDYALDVEARAREELCAELGAAMLGAMAGLAPFHLSDHAAYIGHWLSIVRNDPRALLSAGAKAQAAVDWLIERSGPISGATDLIA